MRSKKNDELLENSQSIQREFFLVIDELLLQQYGVLYQGSLRDNQFYFNLGEFSYVFEFQISKHNKVILVHQNKQFMGLPERFDYAELLKYINDLQELSIRLKNARLKAEYEYQLSLAMLQDLKVEKIKNWTFTISPGGDIIISRTVNNVDRHLLVSIVPQLSRE